MAIWRNIALAAKAANPEMHAADIIEIAGAAAENEIRQLLLLSGVNGIFKNVRLPYMSPRRPREIDLVIATSSRIAVLEIKNWSGQTIVHGGNWIQKKRNGQEIVHNNPIETTKSKAHDLSNLISSRGIRLPADFVTFKVVLTNRNMEIPKEIADDERVISPHKAEEFVKSLRESLLQRMFGISLPSFLTGIET